jgi:hypothetical protein
MEKHCITKRTISSSEKHHDKGKEGKKKDKEEENGEKVE